MSDDNKDQNTLFEEWLRQPFGDLSCLSEFIDDYSIFYVKKAFLDGYEAGFKYKMNLNWQEQNQK